jgi:hypothetical protein
MEVSGHIHGQVKEPLVPIGQKAGWVSEPVLMLCSREKYLATAGNRTSATQLVAKTETFLCQCFYRFISILRFFFFFLAKAVKSVKN